MTIELRPYQQGAVDAVLSYWQSGGGNPLIDLATGTGKSVVIAKLVRDLVEQYPTFRVVILTHVRELVSQNFQALLRTWPQAPAGIYAAGLNKRDVHHRITFASIQSVYNRAAALGKRDLVLIDESHLVPTKGQGMYLTLLDGLRANCQDMRVVGFTATPYRLDSGRLDSGDDRIFHETVYSYGIGEGIADGYLSPLISRASTTEIDVSNVARRGGEFVAGALETAAQRVTAEAVTEIIAYGKDRKSWLLFCSGVDHALQARDEMRSRGISCETVTGKTPNGERDSIIRRFRNGEIRCLSCVNALTTGFDVPQIDLLAMLRSTLSVSLFVQMCGRGTRLSPGKENCIAEGQRVLTDHGLVPIERVTTEMKVWDGFEFVDHCGTVFRGEQEVISYGGLTATTDHKVWTKEGWKAFGQCAVQQTSIAITGDGRKAIRASEGRFRRDRSEEQSRQAAFAHRVHGLRSSISEGLHQLDTRDSGLSLVRKSAPSTEVACYEGDLCKTALHESERQGIRTLRGERNSVRIFVANSHGGLGSREPWPAPGNGTGPHRQRWSLCARQPSLSQPLTKSIKQTRAEGDDQTARIQAVSSGNSLFRQHSSKAVRRGFDASTDNRAIPPTFGKTKRRVWDILNAGPRHSFTVEGLLVHNCLVLDFAGNCRRHGPVDAVSVGPNKSGDGEGKVSVDSVQAKECPDCESLAALNARTCKVCGYEWPREEKPKHEAQADAETGILSTEAVPPKQVPVVDWRFSRHEKMGSPDSLRVNYMAGLSQFSEWIAFEHRGYANEKACSWWLLHGGDTPFPKTIGEALERTDELAMPVSISVKPNGKYFNIVSRSFGKERELA